RSVKTYTINFKRILVKLDLTNVDLFIYFYERLRNNIKDKLSKKNRFDNLYKYIAKAIKINNRLYKR
ncbi:hypothetical protein CONLIGDRAFT_584087, partial [Coniochaeta ligniaria NRRL 30616]